MESRANYAAIGAFVLLMLALGLAFLGWLANFGQNDRQANVRVVFAGAVTGLSTGSAVLFNGIKVGEVSDLSLDVKAAGFRGILATRVLAVSPFMEVVSRNDARVPFEDRSGQWLE